MSGRSGNLYPLPDHLQQFKDEIEKLNAKKLQKLPVLQQLSPRTRKRIALLPAPNKLEKAQIETFLATSKAVPRDSMYDQLSLATDSSRLHAQKLAVDEDWEAKAKAVHRAKLEAVSGDQKFGLVKLQPLDQSSAAYYDSLAEVRERHQRQAIKFRELDAARPRRMVPSDRSTSSSCSGRGGGGSVDGNDGASLASSLAHSTSAQSQRGAVAVEGTTATAAAPGGTDFVPLGAGLEAAAARAAGLPHAHIPAKAHSSKGSPSAAVVGGLSAYPYQSSSLSRLLAESAGAGAAAEKGRRRNSPPAAAASSKTTGAAENAPSGRGRAAAVGARGGGKSAAGAAPKADAPPAKKQRPAPPQPHPKPLPYEEIVRADPLPPPKKERSLLQELLEKRDMQADLDFARSLLTPEQQQQQQQQLQQQQQGTTVEEDVDAQWRRAAHSRGGTRSESPSHSPGSSPSSSLRAWSRGSTRDHQRPRPRPQPRIGPYIEGAAGVDLLAAYLPVLEETTRLADEGRRNLQQQQDLAAQAAVREAAREERDCDFLDFVRTSAYDEIGVDLDPKFTATRMYGRQVKTLVYFWNLSRSMQAFTWLKGQVKLASAARLRRAIRNLQRYGRGLIARSNVREIRRNLILQEEALRKALAARRLLEFTSGCTIYTMMRRNSIKIRRAIRRRKNKAATVIQRRARGMLGRVRAQLRREYVAYLNYHCTVIQCFARKVAATRLLTLLRKLDYVSRWMANIDKVHRDRERRHMEHGAAQCIQRGYVASRIRRRIADMLYWNHVEKSIHLQRMARAMVARIKFRRILTAKRKCDKEQWAAAIVMQQYARRYIALCTDVLYRRQLHDEAKRRRVQERAALLAVAEEKRRSLVPRLRLEGLRKITNPFYYLRAKKMAIRIQRVYRGHRKRTRVAMLRLLGVAQAVFDLDYKRSTAATDIQRIYRGYRFRIHRIRSRRTRLCIALQCVFRCFRAKRKVKLVALKNAAGDIISSKLGKMFRSYQVRRKFMKIVRFTPALVVIQCFCRRYSVARKRMDRQIAERRREYEVRLVANRALLRVLAGYQLRIIRDSYERGIGVRSQVYCGKDCYGFGPVQATMLYALGSKARAEMISIQSNKMDSKQLGKMLLRVPLLCQGSRPPTRAMLRNKDSAAMSRLLGEDDEEDDEYAHFDPGRHFSLLQAITGGLVPLPAGCHMLSPTDVDIAFSKCKDPMGGSVIGFAEYVETVNTLGRMHFHNDKISLAGCAKTPKPSSEVTPAATPARRSSVNVSGADTPASPRNINSGPGSPKAGGTSTAAAPPSLSRSRSLLQAMESVTTIISAARRQFPLNGLQLADAYVDTTYTSSRSEYLAAQQERGGRGPKGGKGGRDKSGGGGDMIAKAVKQATQRVPEYDNSKMSLPTPQDYGFALFVKMLVGLTDSPSMTKVYAWLEEEAHCVLSKVALIIQKQARTYIRRVRAREERKVRRAEQKDSQHTRKITLVQCLVRRFNARQRAAHIAQAFIIKYVPYTTDAPYYVNPSTRVSSWKKPKILRQYDSICIPLPATGLENIVTCGNCTRPATLNCNMCDESMCRICYDTLHCKGKRRLHENSRIPFCSYCKFQLATKDCLTCSIAKPAISNPLAYMSGDRGVFCDTCFAYYHDPCEHVECMRQYSKAVLGLGGGCALHGAIPSGTGSTMSATVKSGTNGVTSNPVVIKDAYLVRQLIKRPLMTEHNFDNLVQTCEECQWRSALWRCTTCDQVYCNTCLVGLHSIGGPFGKHKAEALPYYTPGMHVRFEADAMSQRLQKRIDKVMRQYAKQRAEHRMQCIIRVQAWYRMHLHGRAGRKEMIVRRRRQRRAYRAFRRDDRLVRDKWSYKFREFFGLAPAMPTDTREQQVLRTVPVLMRQRAREYVYRNKADWGYYIGTDEMPPQKGIPKRGFDVGTVEELRDQVQRGGYRLPGRVLVEYNKNEFACTRDLRAVLKAGAVVRLHMCYFRVVEVGNHRVKVDRRWRFEKGELDDRRQGQEAGWEEGGSIGDGSEFTGVASTSLFGPDGSVVMYRMPDPWRGETDGFLHLLRYYSYEAIVGNPIASKYLGTHASVAGALARYGRYMSRLSKRDGQTSDARSWSRWARSCEMQVKWAQSYSIEAPPPPPKKVVPVVEESSGAKEEGNYAEFLAAEQAAKEQAELDAIAAKDKPVEDELRRVGKYWIAPPDFIARRNEEENKLTRDELIAKASEWIMELDPMTELPMYINPETEELSYDVPNPVRAKQMYEEEQARNMAQFAEAQKRIDAMAATKAKKKKL